ncbi:vWA domain-containing protein [Chitinilyticum litopenaei]|uniref:vWA domain-containing protein n=1 Tax=Chitinilyticum litopenaei TaxID=1121276 RepID=UPI000420C2FB|nr:VWA domain-containing protein [Chitinilyticum litopenaei]
MNTFTRLSALLVLSLAACSVSKKEAPPMEADTAKEQGRGKPQPAQERQTAAESKTVTTGLKGMQDSTAPATTAAVPLAKRSAELLARPAPAPVYHYPPQDENRENYAKVNEQPVKDTRQEPVSTFSIDVDTASYANVRRLLKSGQLPPQDAVRVEELLNYFPYDYPRSNSSHPFTVSTEIAPAPWGRDKQLIRIGIKAQEVRPAAMPAANLVFLVDVSGSMNSPAKLPLLQASLKLLVDRLRPQDRVSLVIYASGTGVILEPTSDRERIRMAISQLRAGGSTAGEAGIKLAYQMARQAYIPGGINRILLATDGDFNVGISNIDQLKQLVEREREAGISLTTLGFGTGNYNDALMEQIADIGNGNHHYIDTLNEGQKVLVEEMTSTLATVAKDVKIQVEFNPEQVSEYRLIGYDNRMLRREDFSNDKIDAGEIGAGHTVTALYEVTFTGHAGYLEPSRYAKPKAGKSKGLARNDELAFLRLRYKQPEGSQSTLLEVPLTRNQVKPSFAQASQEFRFATAVAGFGELLRGGKYLPGMDYAGVQRIASSARGADPFGYRGEFVQLVQLAGSLTPGAPADTQE